MKHKQEYQRTNTFQGVCKESRLNLEDEYKHIQLTHDGVFHQPMTLWLFSQVPFKQVPCGSLRWVRGLTLSFSEDHRKHLRIGWVVRYAGRMLTSKIPPSHCDGFWVVCNSRHWIQIVNSHGLAGCRTRLHTKKSCGAAGRITCYLSP